MRRTHLFQDKASSVSLTCGSRALFSSPQGLFIYISGKWATVLKWQHEKTNASEEERQEKWSETVCWESRRGVMICLDKWKNVERNKRNSREGLVSASTTSSILPRPMWAVTHPGHTGEANRTCHWLPQVRAGLRPYLIQLVKNPSILSGRVHYLYSTDLPRQKVML